MTLWSGIGMNYGHDISVSYITAQVESDLSFLRAQGISRLRLAIPVYTDSTTITNCQDMVKRALNHGFYVVWAVTTGASVGTLTATTWSAFKSYVSGTLAAWAQSNGLSELQLGNEEEEKADGSTLTQATVRADIRTLAGTVKSGGYTGKVSYAAQAEQISSWNSEGLGANLDYIEFTCYDTLANFTTNVKNIGANFGPKGLVAEFGSITNGATDYQNENAWYTEVVARINVLKNTGMPAGYFFCYRDGGFGLPVNAFGVQLTNAPDPFRLARYAVLGQALPAAAPAFIVHR